MLELTTLDLLYIVLIFFTTIIWTLLTIVLLRLLKILNVAVEIANIYIKIKQIVSVYSHIPTLVKEKVMGIIKKEEEVENEEKAKQ